MLSINVYFSGKYNYFERKYNLSMLKLLCHSRLKMAPQRLERSKKNEVLSLEGHLKAPICVAMFVPASLGGGGVWGAVKQFYIHKMNIAAHI